MKRRNWQRTGELLEDTKCESVPQRYAGCARTERMLSSSEDQCVKWHARAIVVYRKVIFFKLKNTCSRGCGWGKVGKHRIHNRVSAMQEYEIWAYPSEYSFICSFTQQMFTESLPQARNCA